MMRWIDYAAIVLALLLSLFANWRADQAFRAVIVRVLSETADAWHRLFDLQQLYGLNVYSVLRQLHAEGLVERKEQPGGPARGGYPDVYYRWGVAP